MNTSIVYEKINHVQILILKKPTIYPPIKYAGVGKDFLGF